MMEEISHNGIVKRPFLRKGTGLRRFYKDIDIDSHFNTLSPVKTISDDFGERNYKYIESDGPMSTQPSSVLKSADSPKRFLNVRFSKEPIKKYEINGKGRRSLDFGNDNDEGRNKENCNPNADFSELCSSEDAGSGSDDDEDDDAEGEWETEDEDDDDDESVVQINESIVEEVFKSILKAKAEELLPKSNGRQDPILGYNEPPQTGNKRQIVGSAENQSNKAKESEAAKLPTMLDRAGSPVERELAMFERMEQMTTNQSFCSTASTVRRFVTTELRLSPIADVSTSTSASSVETRLPPPMPQLSLPMPRLPLPIPQLSLPKPPTNLNPLPNFSKPLSHQNPAPAVTDPEFPPVQSNRNPSIEIQSQDSRQYYQALSQVPTSELSPSSYVPNQALQVPQGPTPQPPHLSVTNPAIGNRKQELEQDDQYLRALLTMRIHQLESQIVQHRTENKRMEDVRAKLETERASLEQCKKEFEVRQSKDLAVIDDLKRRLKRDQENLTKELGTTRKQKSAEDETETELKNLRLKVTEQEKELKTRSSRWASSARNYKTTIDELKTENQKLQKYISELKNDKLKLHQRIRRLAKLPADSTQSPNSDDLTKSLVQPEVDVMPLPRSADASLREQYHLFSSKQQAGPAASTAGPASAQAHAGAMVSNAETARIASAPSAVQVREEVDGTGVRRLMSELGYCLEVHYPNGDIKDLREVGSSGVSKYYFKEADSWQIIHPDGTETLQFGSGEVETKFPNGIRETKYTTGIVRRIFPDGMEECIFPDKTLIRTRSEGDKEIHLPNGQIEHHSPNLKIRIYPDGTEKVLYNDGSSLTKYASGRQRFRNSAGEIVYDRSGNDTVSTSSGNKPQYCA